MAKIEKYPRILEIWGSLVVLVTLGEGRVAGKQKHRAAKGRRRLRAGMMATRGMGA